MYLHVYSSNTNTSTNTTSSTNSNNIIRVIFTDTGHCAEIESRSRLQPVLSLVGDSSCLASAAGLLSNRSIPPSECFHLRILRLVFENG